MRKFEELTIWKDSRVFVKEIYVLMQHNKDFGFKDQIQRASVSIMNNIAEGSEAGSDSLYVKYLKISKASCGEVRSMLYLCEDLNYIDKEISEVLIQKANSISGGIHKLIEYLNNCNKLNKSQKTKDERRKTKDIDLRP